MELGPKQRAWVTALRSGEYKQTLGELQASSNSFCCLGVACMVAMPPEDRGTNDLGYLVGYDLGHQNNALNEIGLISTNGTPTYCPEDRFEDLVRYVKSLWLPDFDHGFGLPPESLSLTHLNDEVKLSFEQIADVLENFPDLYFKESK